MVVDRKIWKGSLNDPVKLSLADYENITLNWGQKRMKSLMSLFKFYAQRPLKIQYYYLTEIYLFKNGTEYYKQIHIIHTYMYCIILT